MGGFNIAGIVILFVGLSQSYAKPGNDGKAASNKEAGAGLWNSIGESIKTPGEALPTQIHLPHGPLHDHPAMPDSSQKKESARALQEKQADEALGHEDETIMARPPWRRSHHYWLMHQEKKKKQKSKSK